MKQKIFFYVLALMANGQISSIMPKILEKSFDNETKEIKLKNIGEIEQVLKGSYNNSEYIRIEVSNKSKKQNILNQQIDERILKITQDSEPVFVAASISKDKLNPEKKETLILKLNPKLSSHFINKLPSNKEIIIGIRNKKNTSNKSKANLRKIRL